MLRKILCWFGLCVPCHGCQLNEQGSATDWHCDHCTLHDGIGFDGYKPHCTYCKRWI